MTIAKTNVESACRGRSPARTGQGANHRWVQLTNGSARKQAQHITVDGAPVTRDVMLAQQMGAVWIRSSNTP